MTPSRLAVATIAIAYLFLPGALEAQGNAMLQQADSAYRDLGYEDAVVLARRSTSQNLAPDEWIRAHELMAFAYSAMDSTDAAITTFREVIYSDPDRVYDPDFVAPSILGLHTIALSRELVVRFPEVDSATFPAGQGASQIQFQVSRPSNVGVRLIGQGLSLTLDSLRVTTGVATIRWNGLDTTLTPVPPGDYDVVITAAEFSSEYSRSLQVSVRHGSVDTIPHLAGIPGLDFLPETEQPARSFQPLQFAAITASVITGAVFAMEGESAAGLGRRELLVIDGMSLLSGIVLSLRRPPPRPVAANIEYNRRVTDLVIERNREIASQNERLRRQTTLTIEPAGDTP